ncbi:MAG TPA: type II toxin-antitoxin system VapC family toxin [Terriglobales bacterium]|nr:type II toxin-antitoxin system VapC family toxin [Terriglobales bacterium]
MIVDTSALLAILLSEPDSRRYAEAIASAQVRRISAATYVEAGAVIDSFRSPVASRRLDDLLREAEFVIEPVTEEQARVARDAYRDFGKPRRHAARLNFGDCFAYALACVWREPLLFKGKEFARTDVKPALDS